MMLKKVNVFYEGWGERWHLATLADDGKRTANPLLDPRWVQRQAVVAAGGCQWWGSKLAMSACLVVGRRAMTSHR